MTSFCHSSLPSGRAKQSKDRRRPTAGPAFPVPVGGQTVFSLAWVTKTRSPQTTGDELPSSGSGAFQRTFSVALHFSGASVSGERPSPVGPRQPGQLAAGAATPHANRIAADNRTSIDIIDNSVARLVRRQLLHRRPP